MNGHQKFKIINPIAVALLIFAIISSGIGKGQDSRDSFSNINLSGLSDNSVLSLSGTNVSAFKTFSDTELAALVGVLDTTPTISASDLPTNRWGGALGGTFWSLQQPGMPPLPMDTIGVDVWPLADGSFLLSDLNYDYSPTARFSLAAGPMRMGAMASPNIGGGGVYNPNGSSFPPPNYGTNLWIAETNLSGGMMSGIISNTTPDVGLELQYSTDLTQPWQSADWTVYGSETTNWTPWSLPAFNTSNLFIRVFSTGLDQHGLPVAWEHQYGLTNADPNALDSAGDGWTLYQKYQLGVAPNAWATPAAPQGLTVKYNATAGTAVLSWLPAAGNPTNYTIQRTYLNLYLNGYAPSTSFTNVSAAGLIDNVSTFQPDPLQSGTINVGYQVRANYNGGSSSWSAAVPLEASSFAAAITAGSGETPLLVVQSLPANATSVRLTEIDENRFDYLTDAYVVTNETIPVSTLSGGLSALSNVSEPDFDLCYWVGQAVGSDGSLSAAVDLGGDDQDPEDISPSLAPPFFDARVQLKQNLVFQLRAASLNGPLHFSVPSTNNDDYGDFGEAVSEYQYNPGYAYAGLYPFAETVYDNDFGLLGYGGVDPYLPFIESYLFRNLAFTTDFVDSNGALTTGAGYQDHYLRWRSSDYVSLLRPLTFVYQTNLAPVSPLLDINSSRWLFYDPLATTNDPISAGLYSLDYTNGRVAMAAGSHNWFGLSYLSVNAAYNDIYTGYLATNVVRAGTEVLLPEYDIYAVEEPNVYVETAQPGFETVEYEFWNSNSFYLTNYDQWVFSLPGGPGFSTTNYGARVLLAGVGSPVQIAGYAKLEVTNSIYSGVYAYLGQYFSNAYTMTNGVATATNTGILSPYGEFFATQPGPAALVTMPDLDTGQQGTCTVYAVSLQLDKNHDGTMDLTYAGPDNTSPGSPFVFWCNNNFDRWDNDSFFNTPEQDDQESAVSPGSPTTVTPDCNYQEIYTVGGSYLKYRAIPCTRDLEDFARLWVCGITTNLLAQLPSGSTVTLSWGDVGNPNPANPTIDLFTAADADGGIGYLTNETTAVIQTNAFLSPYLGRIEPGGSIQLNASQFANSWAGNHFIWCGVSNGTGGLTLTIADANSHILVQAKAYIQILDIKQMYERWTVGDNPSVPPLTNAELVTERGPAGIPAFIYPTPTDTNTPYILLVHGYNMKPWEKDRFAETAYKRLYWQGYQGRFGMFGWPTAQNAVQFGASELQAWQSAPGLLSKLKNLNTNYPGHVYLAAHSLGNVVAGEALGLAGSTPVVNTYVAMQGAVSAHAYDPSTAAYNLGVYFDGAPDCYAYYWTNGAPCYFNGSAGAGRYVDFFNTNDWALSIAWLTFQDAKPALNHGYSYTAGVGTYYKNFGATELFFPGDRYQLFANFIQSRSYALGMQPNVGGPFATARQVNLPSIWPPDPLNNGYRAHIYHSAEFRSDNPSRWLFWDTLLFQMGLKNSL